MISNYSTASCWPSGVSNTSHAHIIRDIFHLRNGNITRVSLDDSFPKVLSYVRKNCSSLRLEKEVNDTYTYLLGNLKDPYDDYSETFNTAFLSSVATIWVLIGLIGLIGNLFVLLVLCRNDNKLVYEVFCIGLAITDLIFLCLAVPMTIMHYIFVTWLFGAFLCKIANFIVLVTVYASSLMLFGLTTSRFLAVVHPWKNRKIKVGRAKLACVGAWLIGIICSFPVVILYTLDVQYDDYSDDGQNRTLCVDNGFPSDFSRGVFSVFTVMVTCIVPFSSIIVMNSMIVHSLKREVSKSENQRAEALSCREQRKKKLRAKVTKLVIIVTTLYCVCWLPTHIMNTWYNVHRPSFPQTDFMMILKTISQTLSYASCCINPIVYSAISGSFKAAILKQFPRLSRVFRRGSSAEVEGEGNRTELVTYRSSPSLFRGCRNNDTMADEDRCWSGSTRLLSIDKKHSSNKSPPAAVPMTTTATLASKTIQTNGVVAVVVVTGLPPSPDLEMEKTKSIENQKNAPSNSSGIVGSGKRPTSLPGQPRHQKHSSGSTASAEPHSSVPSITWSSCSPADAEVRSSYLRMSAV